MTSVSPIEFRVPPVDAIALEARAAEFSSRSIKKASKKQGLELSVAMIDLTTLEGMDSPGKVRNLCAKARTPLAGHPEVGQVAAVCVYPDLVEVAVEALKGTDIGVAAVATGFPSGRAPLEVKLCDTKSAVAAGASEIDMVIDRGAFFAGNYGKVFDEICKVKEACGDAHLKVILETGELQTYDNIRRASRIAMLAGADFIKTSTGKISPASTMPVVLLMLECVRDHYLETGVQIGVKAAGGIRTAKQSLRYLAMVNETVGDLWMDPAWFRFGASSLLNDVLMQWVRLSTGAYQRPEEYSKD